MITLNLSIDEVNLILNCVGKQPAKTVYDIIGKIRTQAADQLKKSEKQKPAKKTEK